MIHKIINFLLKPFSINYVKSDNVVFNPFPSNEYVIKKSYMLFVNIGSISNPRWFNHSSINSLNIKDLYRFFKETKKYYKLTSNKNNIFTKDSMTSSSN